MCSHLATPSLGVLEGSNYLPAGHWAASMDFRYFNSRQDLLGSTPQKRPIIYGNTHVYASDFGVSYAVNDNFDVTVGVPVQYGTRETSMEHNFMTDQLHTTRATGFGDMRVVGEYWLFDPKQNGTRNIALGIGVRAPTGEHDLKDDFYRGTTRVERPVDPAIQPGTGGWGLIVTGHAYSSLEFTRYPSTHWLQNTYAYLEGTYVVTPQEYNHTQSPTGDELALTGGQKTLIYDSIPDEFLARGGLTQVIWPSQGLAFSAGLRWEGVPGHDLVGGSDGWRLPGASFSFEPGLSFTRGGNIFSVAVPVALYRIAYKSEAFDRSPNPYPNVDAIADWQLIVTYTHEFGPGAAASSSPPGPPGKK